MIPGRVMKQFFFTFSFTAHSPKAEDISSGQTFPLSLNILLPHLPPTHRMPAVKEPEYISHAIIGKSELQNK